DIGLIIQNANGGAESGIQPNLTINIRFMLSAKFKDFFRQTHTILFALRAFYNAPRKEAKKSLMYRTLPEIKFFIFYD
ncbi:MAG TPA: hypothetical protein PK239_06285, partial [Chitinophagales bacterium]|nr:hypothetical protein [Chitinophagales bacterium]HRK26883.1 hypothetical protein [Chitinophagales bacterium]